MAPRPKSKHNTIKSIKAGYSVRKPAKSNCYTCRIWDPIKRGYSEYSTGIHFTGKPEDLARASARAGEIFAEWVIKRKNTPPTPRTKGPCNTSKFALRWLKAQQGILADMTISNYSIYIESHLSIAFPTLLDIGVSSVKAYYTKRLQRVQRQTVCHELSCLRQLCRWAVEEGLLAAMPNIPNPPARVLGTLFRVRRRVAPDPLSPEEVRANRRRAAD